MFKNDPICEACGQSKAEYFSCFREEDSLHGNWKYTCQCEAGTKRYWIPISGFFGSPSETTDWLLQVHQKTWMDWDGFMDMLRRYRKAANPPVEE